MCSLGPRPDIPRYAFSLPAAGGVVTRRGAIGAAGMLLTSISGIGMPNTPASFIAAAIRGTMRRPSSRAEAIFNGY